MAVDYVPFFDPQRPEESTTAAVRQLRGHLVRYPGKHAAMMFELVLGEGGFYPGNRDFFLALMTVAKEHGVAVLVDEVQAFGRTTELFAFQHFGLDRFVDVVTVGKLTQVCATLFTDEFTPQPGLLSQTFTGATAAIHASRAIIGALLDGGFFGPDGKIARLHAHCEAHLRAIGERHSGMLEGPFGIGAMVAFTPFGGNPGKVKQFIHALFDAGVIAFYCGPDHARVRFLLPLGAVTFEHIDEVMEIVESTLVKTAAAP
jgi:4-aminobutyrate aminotransferase-like enzyme